MLLEKRYLKYQKISKRWFGKFSDLIDEFDDEEFSNLMGCAVEEFYDLLNGCNGSFGEVLDWLENYEEYKEDLDEND